MTVFTPGFAPFFGSLLRSWGTVGGLLVGAAAGATGLYETGPGGDSSFVRFVNGTDVKIVVSNSSTRNKLDLGIQNASRVSSFLPVKAGTRLSARVAVGSQNFTISMVAKPGEFITVAAVPDGSGGWKSLQLREIPSSFTSNRPSLAAFNFNEACQSAQVDSAGKSDGIFKNATTQAIQRRLVGAVKAQVQVSCAGKPMGAPLDLGLLEAGERYSIFLLPSQPISLWAQDAIESDQ